MQKFKAAIVGGGFIGGVHIDAVRRLGNIEVVAICDESGVGEKAKKYHVLSAYEDYQKMIDEVKPDVIHICTPNNTHYEIAKYAIEKNIHVICEKPFTTTIEQARELVDMAKIYDVKGSVNFHNRFYPIPNQMYHMIKQDQIGEVVTVHGSYIQDWLLYETDYSWRLNSAQVGKTRAISDIGSHWLDLAEFVTGMRITKVNALLSTVYPKRKKPMAAVETFAKSDKELRYEDIAIDTEDAATVIFQFENGAIGTLIVSQVFAGKKNAMTLHVAGKTNSLIWDSEELNNLYIGNRNKANEVLTKDADLLCPGVKDLVSYPGGHIEGFSDAFKQMCRQFYQSIEVQGDYYYAAFEDGLREMQLCEAIFNSGKSGSWCKV